MPDSVGQVSLNVRLDDSGINRQAKEIGQRSGGLLSGALTNAFSFAGGQALFTLAAKGINAAIGSIKEGIQVASDLNEVANVVGVTFGKDAIQVDIWATNALKKFGLTKLAAEQYVGSMGAMLKSSGLMPAAIVPMAEGLAGLSGDLASFYNLDHSSAWEKIRSGIAGETEPLKQLGINMSVANMDAYALSQGVTKSYQAMSQAEQITLRYNYLLSVTKDAQGDFTRTSTSWANATRVLGGEWKTLEGIFGSILIQALTPALGVLSQLIQQLTAGASAFKSFINMITGSKDVASSTIQDAAKAAAQAGAAAAQAGIGTSDSLSKSGDAAVKNASKLKSALLGSMDQLNILSSASSGASGTSPAISPTGFGGAGFGGAGAGSGALPSVDSSGLLKNLTDTFANFKIPSFDFAPLIGAFDTLKKALEPFGQTMFKGLEWFWNNILVPLSVYVVNQFLPVFFDDVAAAITLFNAVLVTLAPLGDWLWKNFLQPLASFTGGIIIGVLADLADVLNGVSGWISTNQQLVRGMAITVGIFFAAWKGVELLAFIQMSGGIIGALTNITNAVKAGTVVKLLDKVATMQIQLLYVGDFVKSIVKGTTTLAIQVAQWVAHTAGMVANKVVMLAGIVAGAAMAVVHGVVAVALGVAAAAQWVFNAAMAVGLLPILAVVAAVGLLIAIVVLIVKNWGTIGPFFVGLWEGIKKVFAGIGKWFGDVFNGAWNAIKIAFSAVIGFFQGVWSGIVKIFTSVYTWFGNAFTSAWNGIKYAFSAVGGFFKGIWDGMKSGFSTVVNFLIDGVNSLAKLLLTPLNFVIKGINLISPIKIPELKLTIPNIPRFAGGALVSAPTLAMVGDNRNARSDPEVITPVSKLMDMLKTTFADMGSGSDSDNTPIQVNLMLDTGVIVGSVVTSINRKTRLHGKSILKI